MTDNDIIKALECCNDDGDCSNCPYERARFVDELECTEELHADAHRLINRQKADIERLNETKDEWKLSAINKARRVDELTNEIAKLKFSSMIGATRAEAIKEFAERLKESSFECDVSFGYGREHYTEAVAVIEIDNLVKEMTE